jgi:hypothetical protein
MPVTASVPAPPMAQPASPTAATAPQVTPRQRLSSKALNEQWQKAETALGELFAALGIEHVMWVDDEAQREGIEVVIALTEQLHQLKPSVLQRVYKGRIDAELPLGESAYDVRSDILTEHVNDCGPNEVLELINVLQSEHEKIITSSKTARDSVAEADEAHAVFGVAAGTLFGEMLHVITPEEWSERRTKIMDDAKKNGGSPHHELPNTLVLFDMNLGEGRTDGGHELAKAFMRDFAPQMPLCGIISGDIPPLEERDTWEDPVLGEYIARLSKRDLDQSPLAFVAEVKRIVLSPIAKQVQILLVQKMQDAGAHAQQRVGQVSVVDVVETITLSSEEGVTESETFRRIHDAFFRTRLRSNVLNDTRYDGLVRRLREVVEVAPSAKLPGRRTTAEYQRREMYDDPAEINRLRLPISVGDVFEFASSASPAPAAAALPPAAPGVPVQGDRTQYVLLSQACHTAVRGGGRRVLKVATLARIRAAKEGDASKDYLRPLPLFASSGESTVIDLADTASVPFCALDLCALDQTGLAEATLDTLSTDGLLPGWALYVQSELVPALKEAVLRTEPLRRKGKKRVEATIMDPHGASPLQMTVAADGSKVRYNCTRVGRINEPYATGFLSAFGQYLSHATFDLDMARRN